MDLISIIIPNYNRGDIVAETVQNMLDQDYSNKEVIVVDDGSTDNSIEVLKVFGNQITVLRQKNQGPGAARNLGLSVANGKYIQFMDSDDIASKNKLSCQVSILEKEKSDGAYSPWGKFEIRGKEITLIGPILQSDKLTTTRMKTALLNGWSIVLQMFLFKRSVLDRVGPLRTDINYLEDMDYFIRILMHGASFSFSDEALTIYRNNSENKLSSEEGRFEEVRIAQAKYFDRYIGLLKERPTKHSRYALRRLRHLCAKIYYDLDEREDLLRSYTHFWALRETFPSRSSIDVSEKVAQWRSGYRLRVRGARDSHLFFPSQLTKQQEALIFDLGFNTIHSK